MPTARPKKSALSAANDRAPREHIRALAQFRYELRKFLRFSEQAARSCGVTPQQHQLMLGIAGFAEGDSATISQLAEFLQEKHHSVIGLIERAVQSGLVARRQDSIDRRVVQVSLTPRGESALNELSRLHQDQAQAIAIASSLASASALTTFTLSQGK